MSLLTGPDAAAVVLALAAALHAGFQLTVTLVVYPALAEVRPEDWGERHDAHSRRIVAVVGLTYVVLGAAGAWTLARLLFGAQEVDLWTVLALAGAALSAGVTAFGAGPTHGRLGSRDPVLLHQLLVLDRVRALGAVVAVVGSVAALA